MASTKRLKKRQQKSLKLPQYTQFLVSLLLIIVGASFMVWGSIKDIPIFIYPESRSSTQQFNADPLSQPAKLYIPKMSKNLGVAAGYTTGNRWTTSLSGVSYYTESASPGKGNTVIYGHNTIDTLGGLWRVAEGDDIYVILQSGQFIKYTVSERKEITPEQIEILESTQDSRLTLYTCSGFLDTARFVLIAQQAQKS